MNVALRDLSDRASRAMFSLMKKSKYLNLPFDITIDLFDKTVLHILTYGCEVWGFTCLEMIEKVQLKFMKMLLHLKQTTPSYMIYGELGLYPVSIKIKTRMLMFWFKLLKSRSEHKLSFVLYDFMYKQFEAGLNENKYLTCIRNLLIDVGLYKLWLSQDTNGLNSIWFKAHIKRTLKDHFIQTWYAKIENDSLYTSYRLFKNVFKQEDYIKLLPKNCAIELIRFRTTNNKLPINNLRQVGIDRHERKCNTCSLNEVGDKYHYFLVCPFFQKKRKELFDRFYYEKPNTLKFHDLSNSGSKEKLLKVKHFISIILKEIKS